MNTERLRIGDEVDGFSSRLQGDIAVSKGNEDVLQLTVGGRVDFASQPHFLFLVANLRYGERTGAAFQNAGFAHLRYNYRYTTWLAHEAFTQIEYNQFTLLQRRNLLGTGLRFRLFRSPDEAAFYFGTTYMLEDELRDVDRIALADGHTTVHRWSNYVVAQLQINEQVSIASTVYAQPRFDAFDDIRILNETTISVDLTDRVALLTLFNLRYNSRPVPTVEPTDISLRSGLTVRL